MVLPFQKVDSGGRTQPRLVVRRELGIGVLQAIEAQGSPPVSERHQTAGAAHHAITDRTLE
jgi:hypothetical protein